MRRILFLLGIIFLFAQSAWANQNAKGWCETGAQVVVLSGLQSTTQVQASYPQCTITVFVHGGGLAVINSDNVGTPLANPFTSQTNGQWLFYAPNGHYDVTMSGGGLSSPVTYSDIYLNDMGSATGGIFGIYQAVSFASAITFDASQANVFGVTLTGNNASSVVTKPQQAGQVILIDLCQDGTGGRAFIFPPNFVGSPTISTNPGVCSGTFWYYTGATWHFAGGTGGGGGGGTPGGTAGMSQVNFPLGIFGGTGCQTYPDLIVGPVNVDCDWHPKGPNPAVDIMRFGARNLSAVANVPPQIPGITATINSGSAAATISSATTFVNSDGVTIYGAGVACPLSTPAAPTITSVGDAGGIGTGITAAGPVGATTYSYVVVPVSNTFCFPPASAVGSVTTGAATLGATNNSLVSCSSSTQVKTCTTSAPHQITVGMRVLVTGTTDNVDFGDLQTVDTVPDNTHFTYSNGIDSATGTGTSATGGTVYYWLGTHLVSPTVTGVWEYCFYRTAPTAAFIGCTHPQGLSTAIPDVSIEDWGASINGNLRRPAWLPSTPPVAAQANALTTTIVSGAGTTSLVLANTAGTSVTNATILEDTGPAISAAATFARNNSAPLLIPVGGFVVNSYLSLPSLLGVIQEGSILTNGTIQITNGTMSWKGSVLPIAASSPSFGQYGNPSIIAGDANPAIYVDGGPASFEHIAFSSAATNRSNIVMYSAASPITLKGNTFVTGTTANDLSSIGLILRATNGVGPAQFYLLDENLFIGGPTQNDGLTSAPQVFCQICSYLIMKNTNTSLRDLTISPSQSGLDLVVKGGRAQGGIMPLITILNTSGGLIGARVQVYDFQMDTMAHAVVNLGANLAVDAELVSPGPPSTLTSVFGMVSGRAMRTLFVPISNGSIGQNVNLIQFVGGLSNFSNNTVQVLGAAGNIGYALNPPAAPSCVVSAGGSVPVDTWNYVIYAIDAGGGLSNASPPVTCVTSGGNQTVTITPSAAPAGGLTYVAARSNGGGFGLVNVAATPFGTNMADTFGFTTGTPNSGRGLQAGINNSNISSPQFVLTGGGFKSTASGTFTANRNESVPDLSGTRMEYTGSWIAGHCAQANSTGATTSFADTGATCQGLPTSPTAPNGVSQAVTSTPVGGVGQPAVWALSGVVPRASTCTANADTVLATDRAGYVTWTDASPCAVTLPQAGSGSGGNNDFSHNFVLVGCNIGAGNVTITPTTSTISYTNGTTYTSGAGSLVLTTGQCAFIYSNNTNYFALVVLSGGGGSGTVSNCSTTGALAYFAATGTTVGCNANDILSAGGILTTYASLTTVNLGVPALVATSDLTGQSASIGSTALLTGPAAGHYQIKYYADQAAVSSSGTCAVIYTFNWSDASNARSLTTGPLSLQAVQQTSAYLEGLFDIWVGSGNVTFLTTLSGSCPSGTYDSHVEVIRTK